MPAPVSTSSLPLTPAPHPLRRRWWILGAAILMTIGLGATYSWSVYVPAIRALAGLTQSQAQWPFTTFYIVFPATTIFAGMAYQRIGPRRSSVLGGLLFGGGWLLASLGGHDFRLTILGIGVLGGVGVGCAYIVPLATAILWFPRQKGLITGLAVAGFGGGAWLITRVAEYLMKNAGLTPFAVLGRLGLVFMIVITLAGLVMAHPDGSPHAHPTIKDAAPEPASTVLRQTAFWGLYLAMFAGLAAGFAVTANLRDLYRGPNTGAGVTAIGLFALTNALGRITWGYLFDRWPGTRLIRINLITQALILAAAAFFLRRAPTFQVFALLTGFHYGGVLVLYAAATTRRWGPERLGPVYGWLFSANIPASFAPKVVAAAFDRLGSFGAPLAVLGGLVLLAGLLLPLSVTPAQQSANHRGQ